MRFTAQIIGVSNVARVQHMPVTAQAVLLIYILLAAHLGTRLVCETSRVSSRPKMWDVHWKA
jgi:hypothetical protein